MQLLLVFLGGIFSCERSESESESMSNCDLCQLVVKAAQMVFSDQQTSKAIARIYKLTPIRLFLGCKKTIGEYMERGAGICIASGICPAAEKDLEVERNLSARNSSCEYCLGLIRDLDMTVNKADAVRAMVKHVCGKLSRFISKRCAAALGKHLPSMLRSAGGRLQEDMCFKIGLCSETFDSAGL
jgi:hypothetical protein